MCDPFKPLNHKGHEGSRRNIAQRRHSPSRALVSLVLVLLVTGNDGSFDVPVAIQHVTQHVVQP